MASNYLSQFVDRYSGMEGYGMEPTDIDPVLMQDSFQRSQIENSAREMLSRGATMEDVVQATGLDRQSVENIFMKDSVMGQQPNVMPNPIDPSITQGIMSNSSNDETTQMIIDGMTSGEGEGADIKEFLDVSLGVNKGEDEDLTVGEMLEAGSLAGSKGNQGSFSSYLESSSMLEDMTDPEKMEVYKRAAANMVGELDYESLIEQPDKVMPYLAAGLSLINSGERGEDWGAALGKAFISGKMSSKKEESRYKKSKATLDMQRQGNINSLVTNMALTDVKDRMAMNTAIRKQAYKDDSTIKMYDIAGKNGFADKQTRPLTDTQYKALIKTFPNSVRPTEKQDLKPYTVNADSGSTMNVFMDQDQLAFYQSNPKYAGQIRAGHDERTNMNLYSIDEGNDSKIEKWLTTDEFDNLPEGHIGTILPTSGVPTYVLNKLTNETDFVSPMELARNGAKYEKISSFSGSVTNTDGSVIEFGNSPNGSKAIERQGMKQFDKVRNKIKGIDRAIDNYFVSADNLDGVINDYVSRFPDQADLAFDNLAGRATELADKFVISVKGFGSLFQAAPDQGGSSFYQGDNKVSYDKYKIDLITSKEFETFRNSPIAGFLEANGVTGARKDAALFDLAMLGAGAYSTEKGLDLRAISDFETKQFMRIQGANATTLKQFQAITNDFRGNLINRNILELDRSTEDIDLMDIKKADNTLDIEKVQALKDTRDKYMKKLLDRKEKLSTSISDPKLPGAITFVADDSIDPGNEQVKNLNINISPDSQFALKYGITTPFTTDTKTEIEGTFRDMVNKYSSFANNLEKQDAYFTQLETNLTAQELIIFKAHLQQAKKLGLQ